jgi:hypothetical protein
LVKAPAGAEKSLRLPAFHKRRNSPNNNLESIVANSGVLQDVVSPRDHSTSAVCNVSPGVSNHTCTEETVYGGVTVKF